VSGSRVGSPKGSIVGVRGSKVGTPRGSSVGDNGSTVGEVVGAPETVGCAEVEGISDG